MQLALGNPQRALDHTKEVIQRLNQAVSRYFLAVLLWLQGKVWYPLDKDGQARSALLEAKSVAEGTGQRTILWQILSSLSDLERMRGNELESEKLRRQAREIVNYIVENAGTDALRYSFLAQPLVSRILTGS